MCVATVVIDMDCGLRAVYWGLRAVCDALYLTTIYVVDYGLCVVLCTLLQSGGCGLWGCSVRCLSNEEKYGCGKLAYYAFVTLPPSSLLRLSQP